ncbi:tetratricopeptide repeat-containing sulfotransferase family protein [Chromatocurvus halotolerans]|uniref:tetratricopeptide repeat-containing sulfotransferase family protein n=1 Tax=Chromatocurvus halotolerans TaxID=1132028 RepID=UPI001F0C70EF|nr:tetratricopeptide repeat-containing sulfotransferase family protein [Chromatocurvus halotolerans]
MSGAAATLDEAAVRSRMRAGDFSGALELLAPDEPGADSHRLYLAAVCYRFQGDSAQAENCLNRILAQDPEHGHALQERGHLCRDRGDADGALRAYAYACRANPSLVASFRGQLAILEARDNREAAARVRAQLAHLEDLPRPLVAVTDLLARGRLLQAETLCRRFLQESPRQVEGMRLLAEIGQRLGALEEAEFLLESAAMFEPENIAARIDYVRVLGRRQRFAAAREQAARLRGEHPGNPQLESLHAVQCLQAGDYDAALEGFAAVLEQMPGDPVTLTARGHALKTRGDGDDAVAAYRAALDSSRHYGEAWYSLANLKTYRFDDGDISSMSELLQDADLVTADRVFLCFALGKALEDRRDFADSFARYAEGNRLKRSASHYDADAVTRELAAQREYCSASLFSGLSGAGAPANDPIFIVGMPRAGSTLLEQILSSHSQVDGTQELPNVLAMSQQLRRRRVGDDVPGYPAVLEALKPDELRALGEQFLADTGIHRHGAPRFIDKMPNNFRHIGLIHLMLPNARIIDARREPMACGFSNFKQLFAEGQEFSYDLADTGRYYRDYVALMAHWDTVLPGKVLRVQHEDVLDDLEGQVRRMLDFLGLPFEESCLRYFETERAVRTPSSEQVRRPIYRDAKQQWHNYAAWLEPLRDALGESLVPATSTPDSPSADIH